MRSRSAAFIGAMLFVFLLFAVAVPRAEAVGFFPLAGFVTGTYPHSIAIGDFNGDGFQDLATANSDAGTVSVLLGSGSGRFGTKTDYLAGRSPAAVAIGDFNGDGKQDLVSANTGDDAVSVLIGKGDGTFLPKADFVTSLGPMSVAIGDFNGDGDQDLVTANMGDSTISVLLGKGDGTFLDTADLASGADPRSVAVGDFNGDGNADVAVANHMADSVSVLLGKGNGTFLPKTDVSSGSYPIAVVAADCNGDGKQDLVTANHGNSISVLLGNGDGTFLAKKDFPDEGGPTSVAIGDFNKDGRADLVTANFDANNVGVFLGNGDGTFASKKDFAAGLCPFSIAIGDFNGDGEQDLVASDSMGNAVSVLLQAMPFTITVSPGAHGAITPGTGPVDYGSSTTYAITPDVGYHITSLTVDGAARTVQTSWTFANVTGPHAIAATFAIEITPSVIGSHGSISPSTPQAVSSGAMPKFTFTPDASYYVSAVTVDGGAVALTGANAYTFPAVTASHTISVSFAIDTTTPTTSDDAKYAWQKADVVVHLTAVDSPSGIAETRYRVDGGLWTVGDEVLVAAPANHSGDGVHIINYASTDRAGNVEATQACQVRIDTTAPVTVADTGGIWHSDDVTVRFDPLELGSGATSTEYQVNGGVWTSGKEFSIVALANHSGDGTYTVHYRSADALGNAEVAKTCQFKIDTTPPVTKALAKVTVTSGRRATLRLRVNDALSPKATVIVKVFRGKVLKDVFKLGLRSTNAAVRYSRLCKLARGSYTWKVYAADLAGNKQSKIGYQTLIVR